ncbi:quinon protein alcohol dehydrogenase-like superfamily, partial [Baffinella frigidus]
SLLTHSGTVHAIAVSQCGRRLATGSMDKTVIVWNTHTGEAELQLSGHTETVRSLAFYPDGQRLAGGSDSTTRVWDTSTGGVIRILRREDGGGRAVAWSRDGQMLATGGKSGGVQLVETGTWKMVRSFKGQGQIETLAFSPDGGALAAGGWGRAVYVWDTHTGGLRLCLHGHSDCACSRKDGKLLEDCKIEGHRSFLLSVAFSPDGQRLASSCYRGEIKLWDAATGALLRSFHGGRCAVFAPDVTRR